MEKISPNQIIIFGGGTSIQDGIKLGLYDKLKGSCVIGLNYAYHFYTPTFLSIVDDDLYERSHKDYKDMPLIVMPHKNLHIFDNTIMLPTSAGKYHIDIRHGCYKIMLSGLFGLSLAIYLLGNKEDTEVFLLGYDYGAIGKDKDNRDHTHFYQGKINHRGIGKATYYNIKNKAKMDFDKYNIPERKTKIYNVSPESRIPSFPKINYEQFFKMLDNKKYNQEEVREEVRKILEPIKATIDPKRRLKS